MIVRSISIPHQARYGSSLSKGHPCHRGRHSFGPSLAHPALALLQLWTHIRLCRWSSTQRGPSPKKATPYRLLRPFRPYPLSFARSSAIQCRRTGTKTPVLTPVPMSWSSAGRQPPAPSSLQLRTWYLTHILPSVQVGVSSNQHSAGRPRPLPSAGRYPGHPGAGRSCRARRRPGPVPAGRDRAGERAADGAISCWRPASAAPETGDTQPAASRAAATRTRAQGRAREEASTVQSRPTAELGRAP